MDLTPQNVNDVEFRESKRGYHPDDVDSYVDQVTVLVQRLYRETQDLRRQVEQAQSSSSAGLAPSSSASSSELDETLRRTLVLAQRTADAAVKEAQEEANQVVSDAKREAQRVLADATEGARRQAADAQNQIRVDLSMLETAKAQLQSDVDALRKYLDEEHDNLKSTLQKALDMIEKGKTERRPAPDMHDVSIPADPFVAEQPYEAPADDVFEPAPAPKVEEEEDAGQSGFGGSFLDSEPWTPSEPPSTGSTPIVTEEIDDESYMEELRRAVTDPTPLGPRDDEPPTDTENAAGGGATGFANEDLSDSAFTSDFSSEDFYSADDDGDDPDGFGSRLRRKR